MKKNLFSIKYSCIYGEKVFTKIRILVVIILFSHQLAAQQDSTKYSLRLSVPVLDLPQNTNLPGHYPSMNQALLWGNNFYELAFWGIDELGNSIFRSRPNSLRNKALKYTLSLGFSKYGSELPIPLGIWAHEEFHRTVLGVNGIASKNGNWIFHRWDGTVYGVSDEELSNLKEEKPEALLYSYVAGVQSEVLSTQYNVVQDFHHKRAFYKNALYLYNAYYVWNYFNFSTSAASDSVKVKAPPSEDPLPRGRDFAGADLTAWAYDMFTPNDSYYNRDDFPGGDGENRRIGFSDLPKEAQEYLNKQKGLSLLNFINPAIFFINRINVGRNFSFNAFMQYAPTHFGNDISLVVPFIMKDKNYQVKIHNFNNYTETFWGLDFGRSEIPVTRNIQLSALINTWLQPDNQEFFATSGNLGGALELMVDYKVSNRVSGFISLTGKTDGWLMGNPYIEKNLSGSMGIQYNWSKE